MKLHLTEQFTFDDFNIKEDIEIMTEIFDCSVDQLFQLADISGLNTKEDLDKLYDYCYQNRLYINDIKWQEFKEIFNTTSDKVFCHGSRNGIRGKLRLDVSGDSNDFGNGFYVGETLKQAGMFVSQEPNSSIYIMSFDQENLSSIKFSVSTEWMLAVAYYRGIIDKYSNNDIIQNIINKVNNCDYIVAPIADNRIFELINTFVDGALTDKQTLHALSATYLGYQYVLKTQRALDRVEILDHCYLCPVEKSLYNRSNEIESNTSLNKAFIAKKKYKDVGLYINQLLNYS